MPRRSRTLLLVAVAVISAATVPSVGLGAGALTRTERSVFDAINRQRLAHAARAVVVVPPLERAARDHTDDMVIRGYFSHAGFPDRLWESGVRGPIIGEDLGWSVDDGAAIGRILRMWLASPTHRAILLRTGFHAVGIAVRRGSFAGWPRAVVVTADFEGH